MKTNIQCKILGLAFAGVMFANSQAAYAEVTYAESEGYGLDTHVGVLANSVNLDVGPLGDAQGNSPDGVTTYDDTQSAIQLNVSGDGSGHFDTGSDALISGQANLDIADGVFNGQASYGFDATHNAMEASASSSMNNLDASLSLATNVNVLGLASLSLSVDDLVGVSGTLYSEAEVWGDYGSWGTSGSSYIEDLSLDLGLASIVDANFIADTANILTGSVITETDVDGHVRISAAANTGISLDALGLLGVTLLLNEQVENCTDNFCEMTVNAFRLSVSALAGLVAEVDLTIGHSYARMEAAPSAVPVPAAVWLFGSGLMGLVGLSRRRQSQLSA